MAVNLHTKYEKNIADAYVRESLIKGRISDWYSFVGARTVKVTTPQTVPMTDYVREGANRYGEPTEMGDIVQEMTLTQDRSFSLVIDKGNNLDQSGLKSASRMLGLQIREQAIPEMDRYCFKKLAETGGTIVGNIVVFNGSDTEMLNGEWLDGMVTVDSINKAASLTVKDGATIDGIQVRVLDSVASGDSENDSEASAVQDASYVEEDGADVKSPVLYFHRLTTDQKSDLVITYDYNGGLDAQNWSGIQRTGEGEEYDLSNMPAPTKPGYKLVGWEYAEVDDPESLSMAGTSAYQEGDVATRSLRLIAQWAPIEDDTTTYPEIIIPGGDNFGENTFPNTETIQPNDTPLAGDVIEDEDVPLAGLPNTGSESGNALLFAGMAAIVMAGAAVFVIRRRNAESK